MSCKNCSSTLVNYSLFCNQCGAKIVNDRLTIKGLATDLSNNLLGWDNKFFFTIKNLLLRPHVVFREYLGGTRKRYMNPFTILGLTTAIAIFLFNFFAEQYLALNIESNMQSITMMSNMMEKKLGNDFDKIAYEQETLKMVTDASQFMLKYFNLLVILLMPLYTYMAFLVYRKPYNYAEHLIINSYIQSISFIVTSIIFTISVFTSPSVYLITVFFLVFYYIYAYGKLYNLSVAESILKVLVFMAILAGTLIIFFILSIGFGYILAALSS
ncbi:DUF3667 domain-containing protein [Maribacter litoralis]|uniref:DUF3667 domain-containing protein n=1 Tax=Maribacter litoralis TaxID=2059726 RepID=UPI000E31F59C|nr:DUF3667 domain-containing protein [Maribacter litoralis]